jgi:hypothetical protein
VGWYCFENDIKLIYMKKILILSFLIGSFSAKSQSPMDTTLQNFFNRVCCNNTIPTPPVGVPPNIEYTQTTFTFTQGTAVNICPTTLTGDPTIVVTVSPSLPPNLVLNPSTGCITGIPSGTSSPANYTFTATNNFGNDTDIVSVKVNADTSCYQKNVTNDVFTAQSGFPAKIALTGTGALQETVYNNTYVTGAEADGQYSLRNGSGNDQNGSSSSYGIAFNFAIQGGFVPNKIYSQKLIGTVGDLYKGGIWARERSSGVKAQFSIKVYDGATLIASGLTGSVSNTYTNYKTNSFTMPASGQVTIEVWNELNGNASGNDPVLDGIGLAQVSTSIVKYKRITNNSTITYFYENGTPVTGAALTQLQTDISNGTASKITCTF